MWTPSLQGLCLCDHWTETDTGLSHTSMNSPVTQDSAVEREKKRLCNCKCRGWRMLVMGWIALTTRVHVGMVIVSVVSELGFIIDVVWWPGHIFFTSGSPFYKESVNSKCIFDKVIIGRIFRGHLSHNFVHDTIAKLSCHVQNYGSIDQWHSICDEILYHQIIINC